jgi:hypothetical protein
MNEPSRSLLSCAAALLDQGRTVDCLSRPVTAAALIGILVYPAIVEQPVWMLVGFAMLVALAGLAETYFAIRVGFDAALFHQLAGASEAPDFAETDAALARLGRLPTTKLGRSAEARVAGGRRLFRCQILSLVAQGLSILVGAWIALMWR